ncbi:glycosyltransferase, partial [Candidatus Parcubacteria bacterium]|nr:glycosyltransferase [Candidatus Parcubacteria bacterium]
SHPNKFGKYILYVGQMFPRRHAFESILAFEKIAPNFPDLKFVLVGTDKYEPPRIAGLIEQVNARLGSERIIHYTYIEDDREIASMYAHAELFVYISSSEAFGLPPVEAASHGVPVIVSDSPINHELFGDAAFFVPEFTTEAIAKEMKEGLENTSKRESFKDSYKNLMPDLSRYNFAKRFFDAIS